MLRPTVRLRKIAIRILDLRILIAMPKLFSQPAIAIVPMFFFDSTFGAVRIVFGNFHNEIPTSQNYIPGRAVAETPSFLSRSRACKASFDRG
jgi:hypothetical protein